MRPIVRRTQVPRCSCVILVHATFRVLVRAWETGERRFLNHQRTHGLLRRCGRRARVPAVPGTTNVLVPARNKFRLARCRRRGA